MRKRSKISLPTSSVTTQPKKEGLTLHDMRGLVSPISAKTTTVTLRLSGHWHVLWERLRTSMPELSDAEILRQAVAMRLATVAVDAKGKKPKATIQYHDNAGKLVRSDLEEYVGITQA